MTAATFTTMAFEYAMLALAGLAVFVAPGAVLLSAAGVRLRHGEKLAFFFAASLALLTVTFAACLFIEASIAAAPVVLVMLTVATAAAVRVLSRSRFATGSGATLDDDCARVAAPMLSRIVLALLVLLSVCAAVAFAPVGSVDRWWYLAYVRSYLDAPVLTTAEPFLGTGQTFARFGMHPWLLGLAIWSWLTGADPVFVYEGAAPVLVVLAAVSAAFALAWQLFGQGMRARLCVAATMLLWSGGLIPVLARAGEDKVLAASALIPLCAAAFLRVIAGARASASIGGALDPAPIGGRPRFADLLLLGVASAATAAVHALAYAFVLVALLPVVAFLAFRFPASRRASAAACVLLVVLGLAPGLSGLVVRERLHDIGAELDTADHPVVRVHEGRERLIELPAGAIVVTPRLLFHPLALLALAGLLLLRRPQGSTSNRAPVNQTTQLFLVVTAVLPLLIAFVPPLPSLAGELIPPWMVYRVLWLLPLASLAALAADRIAARTASPESVAMLMLLALGLPLTADSASARLAEARTRKAAPADEGFRGLVESIAALPRDARIAAPPELSERLPAFAARAMVAGLDRSTVVFAGSRERGEARLRARAGLLSGDADSSVLARAADAVATHAVFDPRTDIKPGCSRVLFVHDGYALCELARDATAMPPTARLELVEAAEVRTLADARCDSSVPARRRDPWSATAPAVRCRIDVPSTLPENGQLVLLIRTNTARAVDELRIALRERENGDRVAVVRSAGRAGIALVLDDVPADVIELSIASSFLPSLRLDQVALAVKLPASRSGEAPAPLESN